MSFHFLMRFHPLTDNGMNTTTHLNNFFQHKQKQRARKCRFEIAVIYSSEQDYKNKVLYVSVNFHLLFLCLDWSFTYEERFVKVIREFQQNLYGFVKSDVDITGITKLKEPD